MLDVSSAALKTCVSSITSSLRLGFAVDIPGGVVSLTILIARGHLDVDMHGGAVELDLGRLSRPWVKAPRIQDEFMQVPGHAVSLRGQTRLTHAGKRGLHRKRQIA